MAYRMPCVQADFYRPIELPEDGLRLLEFDAAAHQLWYAPS